jgi:hypothetical protein
MAGYFISRIPEIRQAQARIPVAMARPMDTMEIKKVDLSPVKNRGRYSRMTLRLKSASIKPSVLLRGCAFHGKAQPLWLI